ncbi:hypothetical protein B0T24DRAFT_151296 [Lasiosphaeria ovina]|uniref:Secreted protein n=1 Tax=Lasiosphaeria ovina TaxID=92902 RepID=A0AAE0NDB7_9PEZI|nr:hypothetical protein B0T24DRAFT_151296 [Lasiosphaeria ovina]
MRSRVIFFFNFFSIPTAAALAAEVVAASNQKRRSFLGKFICTHNTVNRQVVIPKCYRPSQFLWPLFQVYLNT